MPGRKTILVADDDQQVRRALHLRLQSHGYDVIEAPDGIGALARCRGSRIDAVILDQGMPLGDGRSIAEAIRQRSDVPIVFLSGHNREDFRPVVSRYRDLFYLPKPLDEGRLLKLLASIVRDNPGETEPGDTTELVGAGEQLPGAA